MNMLNTTEKEKLEQKIAIWKNRLIDLSRRNSLLHFRPHKVTTIEIVDELPSEVFKSIIIENNSFHFLPKVDDLFEQKQQEIQGETDIKFFEYNFNDLDEKHTDLDLQTNLSDERLQKNLKRIHFRANQLIEEQGYNTLYLTLGMLEWYEVEQSDVKNRSPLIMVPVQLKKRSIRSKYKLYHSDEDPFINPAVQYKLVNDFKLSLPDLPDVSLGDNSFQPQEYLKSVKEIVKTNPRWRITNEIYLGLFSFAKFVMFKDLEKYNETFKNNPVVQALAGISSNEKNNSSDYIKADELDEKRKPLELFQILDADSSQQEAIEAVKAGNSIVIQGPPGTGKSQTITNLIAELLANNKKVLFVSEKMAALDVVYKKLQSAELGDYCLEIHSRKANKRHVLNQLKDAYESKHPGKPIIDSKIDELLSKKKQLNEYSTILHKPVAPFNKTPYWFLGQLNQDRDIKILDIDFSDLSNMSFQQYESILSTIETLKVRIEMIGHPHKNPFWGCEINNINEYERQKLESNLKSTISIFDNLNEQIQNLSTGLNIKLENITTVMPYCELLTVLVEEHQLPESLIKIDDVDQFLLDLKPVLKDVNSFQKQNKEILEKYRENIFDEDVRAVFEKLKTSYKSFWRIFIPGYYKLRKRVTRYLISKVSISFPELLADTERITENVDLRKKINSTSANITEPLANLWNSTNTKTDLVTITMGWLKKYRDARFLKTDDDKLTKFILNSDSIPEELINQKNFIEKILPKFKNQVEIILKSLVVNNEIVFPLGINNTPIEILDEIFNRWKNNIQLIVDWARYQKAFNNCKKAGIELFLEVMYSEKNGTEELIQKFKKSFLFHLFQKVLNNNPILKDFEALTQDQAVKKFRELDSFQLELARLRVLTNLFENKPDSSWEGAKSSQLGYLQKQFRLKRGHHPIRKILANVPTIVQQLCPCFMMSPLSLSQYIDPENIRFDFVIFDEASQMSPVDSLGAIIRGNHLVCVGDEHQLPPTTFFDKIVQTFSDDDDLDDLTTPDLESILHECLTIGMKEFYLKWHYRSRHESLIHFSNISFYKNKLNTFPNPDMDTKDLGLSLVYIADAIYERGGSQKNKKEAQEVAKAVFNHYKTNPEKSLGVGTFSQSQQTAIYDELELLRRNDPSLERYFAGNMEESFFVKNLETIQGDERDIIFISVGYGKDANGKMTMNFGPLNKAGGERRLNVLVTRAREKVVVFSSITGDDFDLSTTQALGVHKLKQYLDFVKSHGDQTLLSQSQNLSGEFDESNVFERSVYKQLQEKGIKSIPQVGYAGYKIDFAILHHQNPAKFILAVECDGANYHSSATARDRDRLRQQVLENLGWRFYRIWSTDWFLNPSREMSKLLEAIEIAKTYPLHLASVPEKPELKIENVNSTNRNNNLGIKVIPYVKYPVSYKGDPEMFYHEVESSYKVKSLIEEIVKVESPIHIKELSLRVIQHFDMGRVGAKIIRIMESLVNQLHQDGKIHYTYNFIYKSTKPFKNIRKRDNTGAVTNVEFISRDEIQNSIILVLSKEISIPQEELVPKVARIFGYQHTGTKIQESIKKQITYLLKQGKITDTSYGLEIQR